MESFPFDIMHTFALIRLRFTRLVIIISWRIVSSFFHAQEGQVMHVVWTEKTWGSMLQL